MLVKYFEEYNENKKKQNQSYDENADLISTLGILQENLVLAIREIGEKYGVSYSDIELYSKSRYIIKELLKDVESFF